MKQKEGKRAWLHKGRSDEKYTKHKTGKMDVFITIKRLDDFPLCTPYFLHKHLFTVIIQDTRFGSVDYSGIYIKSKLIESYKEKQAHETTAQEVIHFYRQEEGM